MSLFDDLLQNETLSSVRARIVELAQAADLAITNWLDGGTGEQILETVTQATYADSLSTSAAIRGFASLDTSTDPGDEDAFDENNANLPAAAGFLSNLGENFYGTTRIEKTFATGFVTFENAGPGARTFAPGALTFTWTEGDPPDPAPTYRNAADASIYTNPDGTVTVAADDELVLPVVAEQAGTDSNATAEALSLTTTLDGCSATNELPISGTDRESAPLFRARCRKAPARVSLGGPAAAIEYLAQTNLDGTPLLNESDAAVNITRVQVTQDSDTGVVQAFFASPSGAAVAEDVTAANANIEAEAFAMPDAITYTGQAATQIVIHVAGTAKIKASAGLTAATVKAAIVAALEEAFESFDIGGVDQDSEGSGVIYRDDIEVIAASAYPGLYNVVVTTPAPDSVAMPLGHVPVVQTVVGDWEVTLV